jgi:4-aminobutyrate aminotransferase-like enzyme
VRDRTTKEPADAETSWIHQTLVDNGLICINSGYYFNRLCFAPPLVITREEIDRAIDILDRVLHAAEQQFATLPRAATVAK